MSWQEIRERIDRIAGAAEDDLHVLFGSGTVPRDAAAEAFRLYLEQSHSLNGPIDNWEIDFETSIRTSASDENVFTALGSLDFRYELEGVHLSLKKRWAKVAEEIYFEGDTLLNKDLKEALKPPDSVGTFADSALHSSGVAGRFSQHSWSTFIETELNRFTPDLRGTCGLTSELYPLSTFWNNNSEWCRSFHVEEESAAPGSKRPRRLSFWEKLIRWIMAAFGKRDSSELQKEPRVTSSSDHEIPPFLPSPHLADAAASIEELRNWWKSCQTDARRLDQADHELNRRLTDISNEAARLKETVAQFFIPNAPMRDDWEGRRRRQAHEFDRISAAIDYIVNSDSADTPPVDNSTPSF